MRSLRIEPRRTISNADGSNSTHEYLTIGSISIPDQVTRDLLPATRLRQLIGDPFGRWMRGHAKPQDLPPAVAQQSIEQPERDCRHDKEVHGDNTVRMVAKERLPALRGRNPPPCHILGYTGLTYVDAELEKLPMDSRRSPQWVGDAHLAD